MSEQHTPGPWSQGRLLNTRETRRMSELGRATAENREQRMVFSNFYSSDEGRSRVLVAECAEPADARLIAAAPEMYEALAAIANEWDKGVLGEKELGHIAIDVLKKLESR